MGESIVIVPRSEVLGEWGVVFYGAIALNPSSIVHGSPAIALNLLPISRFRTLNLGFLTQNFSHLH